MFNFVNARPCECTAPSLCDNYVRVHDMEKYCTSDSENEDFFKEKRENAVITMDIHAKHNFDLVFYSVYYGKCKGGDVNCRGCVSKELACGRKELSCNSKGSGICSKNASVNNDDKWSSHNVAYVTVASASAVIFVCIIICTCVRSTRVPKKRQLPLPRSFFRSGNAIPGREWMTHVMRQVSSPNQGRDRNVLESGTTATTTTDISSVCPPPSYSSLEHTDTQSKSATCDDEENLPSYTEAVRYQEKYKVVNFIQHV